MTTLHVIYRVDDEGTPDELWTTYSFPEGIYVSGDTLQRTRLAFHQAMQVHFTPDELAGPDISEHIERPVVDDIYVRVAVDRYSLDRDIAAAALKASLTVSARAPEIRSDFAAAMWPTLADERVVVACVARDPIRWVLDQTSAMDAVGVCTAGPSVPGQETFLAWIPLLREGAAGQPVPPGAPEIESLAAGGLGVDSTVGELLTAKVSHGARPAPVLVGSAAA